MKVNKNKRPDFWKGFDFACQLLLDMGYDKTSTHPFNIADCLKGKANRLPKNKVRKNPSMVLYVVGNVTNEKHESWKILGVFTKEADAVKNCIDKNHFVGAVELNKVYRKDQKWKGAYYPKLENKPKTTVKKRTKKKLIGKYYYDMYYSYKSGGDIYMLRVNADSYKEAKKRFFKVLGKDTVISHYVKN